MFPRSLIAVLAFLAVLTFCFADDVSSKIDSSFSCRTWTSNDGLPDNTVGAIAQSHEGFLWVSTQGGLAEFNGVEFTRHPLPETSAITSRLIRTMLCDRRGALWVALENGDVMRIFRGATMLIPMHSTTTRDSPMSMCEDGEGAIWIGFERGRICRIRDLQPEFFSAEQGLSGKSRACVRADAHGQVWYSCGDEAGYFKEGKFVTILNRLPAPIHILPCRDGSLAIATRTGVRRFQNPAEAESEEPFPNEDVSHDISSMLEDRHGRIWIGNYAGGLFCWSDGKIARISTPSDVVLGLMEDREGNLWVGMEGGGLGQIRRRVVELVGAERGLTSTVMRSLAVDREGAIWMAGRDGQVTSWTTRGELQHHPPPPWSATCLAVDGEGRMWVGTGNQGLYHMEKEHYRPVTGAPRLAEDNVRALLASRNGDLWAAGQSSGLHRLRNGVLATLTLTMPIDYVRALAEGPDGKVWAGTFGGHLLTVKEDALVDATPAGFPSNSSVRSLHCASDGVLWVGFAQHGLGRIRDGKFGRVSSAQGLWDDAVSQILTDGEGRLWIGCNRGIYTIFVADFEAVAAQREARLRSNALGHGAGIVSLQATFGNSPNAVDLPDHRLAFPTSAGLLIADPEAIETNATPPQVTVKWCDVDGIREDARGASEGIRAPSRHQRVRFVYDAYSFLEPERVLFRHRLKGLETAWSIEGPERVATYDRVPPGSYTFQVTACNSDGVWSDRAAEVRFTVLPAIWQKWWFRALSAAVAMGLAVAVARYLFLRRLRQRLRRLEREAAVEQERARIARDMHDELGANLTRIALLGDLVRDSVNGDEEAAVQAGQISGTARQSLKSLDEIVWAVNPRNDSLPNLLEYLGQVAIEYLSLSNIRCRIEYPEMIPARQLTAEARHNLFLAAKEALHNVVKHAVASEVEIQASISDHAVRLAIRDNGHGFDGIPKNGDADGLLNIRERMKQAGGEAVIESKVREGTRVTLVLPLE